MDVTEYETTPIPFNFRFSDYPGQITYSNVNQANLFYPMDESLNPFNPFSPLKNLLDGKFLDIYFRDNEISSLERFGTVNNAVRSNNELVLTIDDSIQKILNKSMILVNYYQKTPVEIAVLILESYGIEVDKSSIFLLKKTQEDNGLLFDFSTGVGETLAMIEVVNQLCQAGFMRACIYNNTVYFLNNFDAVQIDILPQEVLSVPQQSQQAIETFNGGEIKYVGGIVTGAKDPSKLDSPLVLDYSVNSMLQLNNPSGAYYLFDVYSDRDQVGLYFEMEIIRNISLSLKPGINVRLKAPIMNPTKDVFGKLVGKETAGFHAYKCTFEVL